MKNAVKVTKEFFLEMARYAGTVVVGGFCIWLVVFGVFFLARTAPKNA